MEKNKKNELNSISPFLEKHKIEEHYEIPKGYFEGLTETIIDKASTAQNPVLTIFPSVLLKVAAVVSLVGVSLLVLWNQDFTNEPLSPMVAIEADDAIDYFINNTNLLELEELEEFGFGESDLSDMDILEINNELIDDYLNENLEGIDENLFDELL